VSEFKGPIVEGAWYLTKAKTVVGPAQWEDARRKGWWVIAGASYNSKGQASDLYPEAPDIECRVYITHTDPAEVVAELTARSEAAYAKQTAYDGGYHQAVSNAYESAADLVAEKLGVK
jgi:hypothetical protein